MPIFEYSCGSCGKKQEIFLHKVRPRIKIMCECGKQMLKMISRINTEKDNPRWSKAMGVNISQIPEARRLYPDSTYNEKGDLLIRNRKHKLQEIKRRGMTELD